MDSIALTSNDELTTLIVESGVVTWDDLVRVVEQFHYGRNLNREDFDLVWSERKGTCSSKHAFLKHVADLNKIPDITLMLCIYEMKEENTEGVGDVLTQYKLSSIPEAHCYLSTPMGKIDVTTAQSSFSKIANDVLKEEIINAVDVVKYKVQQHKSFVDLWAEKNTHLSGSEVWKIREACIQALEQ